MLSQPWTPLLLLCAQLATSNPTPRRSLLEPYAPYEVSCPKSVSVRLANALSDGEAQYINARKTVANENLASWISSAWGENVSGDLPSVAMAVSGGGTKAGLLSAGAFQALDGRDSPNGVGGLLQGLLYISALSGGSLTLTGQMVNNFSQISVLKENLYNVNYLDPLKKPLSNLARLVADLLAKGLAGYRTTLIDLYGKALAYDFIGGPDFPAGPDQVTWSSIIKQTAFTGHQAPFPIITMTNANVSYEETAPLPDAPIWEVSPVEFGSWDATVHGFLATEYLGTTMHNGATQSPGLCTKGFDNTGFISGMSSNIVVDFFYSNCSGLTDSGATESPATELIELLDQVVPILSLSSPFGVIPNPFYGLASAPKIEGQKDLYMLDGAHSGQGIPIFPFLQPARNIDVIVAIDSESFAHNVTDGSSLYSTYTAAKANGLTRMPVVPDVSTFLVESLFARPQFFGCNDPSVATLIFLPDTNATDGAARTLSFSPEQVQETFQHGIDLATQSGDEEWPRCLACGIMQGVEGASLPDFCDACLSEYCWKG